MKSIISCLLLIFLTSVCKEKDDVDVANSFTKISSGTNLELFDIQFSSPTNGIIVGAEGTILRSTDGGSTWTKQTSGTAKNLRAIRMNDATNGFACGQDGTLLKTNDGGSTWSAIDFPNKEGALMDFLFIDPSTFLVAHSRGNIYKTTNGGTSWDVVQSNATDFFTGFHLVGDAKLKLFAYGGGGSASASTTALYSSADKGTTWTKEKVEFGETITSMDFGSETVGFFTSYNNIVYKTSDTGANWSRITTPINVTWREVKFISPTVGFITGEKGKAIKTEDGGNTWTEVTTGESGGIYSMEFLGHNNTLYAVGENGAILAYRK